MGVSVVIGRDLPDTHCQQILDKLQLQSQIVNILPSVVCVGLICPVCHAMETTYIDRGTYIPEVICLFP